MSLYAVVDPKTGDVVREYPTATDKQIEQALASASKAYHPVVEELDAGPARGPDPPRRRPHTSAARNWPTSSTGRWVSPSTRRWARWTSAPRSTVVRRQCREVPGRRADRTARRRTARSSGADRSACCWHHAVELPVLPGGAVRRTQPDAGQHGGALQARSAVPRVRGSHPEDLRRRRLPRGRLRQRLRHQQSRSRRRSPTRACRACRSPARSGRAPRWPRSPACNLKKVVLELGGSIRSSC